MNETDQWVTNLRRELNGAALYRALADAEPNPNLAEVYRRLSTIERRHAETWAERLRQAKVHLPEFRPSWRTKMLIWLARGFGASLVLPSIASLEQVDSHDYVQQADDRTVSMAADEQSHARLLRHITQFPGRGLEGGAVAQLEGRHRATGGNALRAAVLGANDGLVSNLSLVMGVAGAELPGPTILISGLAGLLAGAFSMALGEWLSVQSSRELYQHQIRIEKAEIATAPEEELVELALIYQARGLDEAQARRLAAQIMEDETSALETLAREELGIDPKALGGSAWEAATTSFLLFALGAIVPVIPFLFVAGMTAVVISLLGSAVGLFAIGAGITLFTARSVAVSGTRQVAFGLTAATITYAIGRLIGVSIGG
ncbi:MAG: VIT1/CCC1 transporter family protein [Chloroflexi bacterium]|nr:VIT1/CCC1 transporter family protein [Chloroflexota bacterium]